MSFYPLQDRILVKRLPSEEKTSSGLIIPDSAAEKPMEGEVVAIGKGRIADDGNRISPDVEIGQKVLFGKYSGTDIKLEGVEHLIVREDEILAVIEG